MTTKQKRRKQLLEWRFVQYAKSNAEELADSLSGESLPWTSGIPHWLEKAIIEFRHLRRDARVSVCSSFLRGRNASDSKLPLRGENHD